MNWIASTRTRVGRLFKNIVFFVEIIAYRKTPVFKKCVLVTHLLSKHQDVQNPFYLVSLHRDK